MILRRATEKDIESLAHFFKKELDGLGVRHTITLMRLKEVTEAQRLNITLEEDKIISALWARPIQTVNGPGWEVLVIAAAADYPDKIRAMDAVCVYSLNRAIQQGRNAIYARHDTHDSVVYGRDVLGMEEKGVGIDTTTGEVTVVDQWGDARTILKHILDRRPEWVLSP